MIENKTILECLGKVKACDILIYDMKGFSPFYDTMILASVDSERQASASVNYIKEEANRAGHSVRGIEGLDTPWVLIDLHNVIISIFTKEERERFSLEKIYLDIPCTKYED
ncbi:MAG: ribosome silencing factor [Anaeroplasmataceae bacterium]|jgi:iojap-like ribosome-associated protein|nr:ribosome silencing factor [Anaeroplasmataceae bacterium]